MIDKLDETDTKNEKIEKLRKHFKDNKKLYAGIGIGFAGFTAGVAACVARERVAQVVQETTGISLRPIVVALFSNKVSATAIFNQIIIPALGDPGDVVQVIESTPELAKQGILAGMMFASKNAAAHALDASRRELMQHLDGKNPDLKGAVLQVVGKAGHPIPQ